MQVDTKSISTSSTSRINIEPQSSVISMDSVSKSYGDRTVLDSINISLQQGEKVALIGPSGSGKTTILRVAIGLVKPDSGTISYRW
ncbi:ATP-binding cassette domain-containing protein [Ochrobactrum teleogrylli]